MIMWFLLFMFMLNSVALLIILPAAKQIYTDNRADLDLKEAIDLLRVINASR